MSNHELANSEQILSVTEMYEFQLANLLRYARFIDGETPQEWVFLLGPDVVGLTHPDVTVEIAENFINFNAAHGIELSEDEQALLLTATKVHDWGEIMVGSQGVGDVTFEEKTTTHEHEELKIFNFLLEGIEDVDTRDFLKEAYIEVVLDNNSKLGKMFNAIERIGYLGTAIRAYLGIDTKRITNWQGLVGNVLSNQIVMLLDYRNTYPYVDMLLNQSASVIDEMFSSVLSNKVSMDNEGNYSYDLNRLKDAHMNWLLRFKN